MSVFLVSWLVWISVHFYNLVLRHVVVQLNVILFVNYFQSQHIHFTNDLMVYFLHYTIVIISSICNSIIILLLKFSSFFNKA